MAIAKANGVVADNGEYIQTYSPERNALGYFYAKNAFNYHRSTAFILSFRRFNVVIPPK